MQKKRTFSWGRTRYGGRMIHHLAGSLYEDRGACLAELWRNAAIAYMIGRKWNHRAVVRPIEILLVLDHPLAPGCISLVILDFGSGFTEENIKRFLNIGGDEEDELLVRHSGAGEKQLGRISAFSLPKKDGKYARRFWLLTRTAASGEVSLVSVTQAAFGGNQEIGGEYISEDSNFLGPAAIREQLTGSFSMFVIPDTEYADPEEIRRDLEWRLPRKADKAIPTNVQRKPLIAPKLASRHHVTERVDIHIERTPKGEVGGIWLTDAETGIRCAQAIKLEGQLPFPLYRPDLRGDIFIPNLLANQGTNRAGLNSNFFKTKAWRQIVDDLRLEAVDFAESVLGDMDTFSADREDDALLDGIRDLCSEVWGPPAVEVPPPPRQKPKDPSAGGKGGGGEPTSGPDEGSTPPTPPGPGNTPGKSRSKGINICGKTYWLSPLSSLGPAIYARIEAPKGTRHPTIYVNQNGYKGAPNAKAARQEHLLMQILLTVANSEHVDDPIEAQHWLGQTLCTLRQGPNKKP